MRARLASKGVLASCAPEHTEVSADYQFSGILNKCRRETGTCGEGGAATADAKSRCTRAMHMRDDSCHAGVARATDHNQGIEGTYLSCAGQRGRAVSCEPAEPCPCHSGTGESTMFYARCTLPNLTACIHSPYSYIICVPEAKMAARSPPTPSLRYGRR